MVCKQNSFGMKLNKDCIWNEYIYLFIFILFDKYFLLIIISNNPAIIGSKPCEPYGLCKIIILLTSSYF